MTDSSASRLNLIPDAPITSSNYDRLDRMSFVRSFAEAIRSVEGADSVVLALAGPWGSGKSSLLNLVMQELEAGDEKAPLVMRFNPWWFSGTDQLVPAFLQQLGAAVSRPMVKETMGSATHALDRLAAAIANPGIMVDLVEDPTNRDIQLIREEVDEVFRNADRRILIMMDDIDRLTPREMSQLLLIVRAVADLPNTTYVLSFDYEVVVESIGEKLGVDGRTYLEKVVQLQIDVPLPGRMTLERMVVGQLAAIDPSSTALNHEAQRNFRLLFEGGVKHFLATPRACTRLLNVLRFTYPTLAGQVYFPDLLGICCLMSFSSQAIQAIRSHSEMFVGPCNERGRGWLNLRQFHASWLSRLPKRDRPSVESIVRLLFPKMAWALNGPLRDDEYAEIWDQEKRICSEKHYDAYFRLGISAGEAAERQWRNMVGLLDDAAAFAQALQRFGPLEEESAMNWVDELLRKTTDFVNEQATPEQAAKLFQAIMRRGDQIAAVKDDHPERHLFIDPVHWVATVLLECLQRIDSPRRRFKVLTESVAEDAGLLTGCELLELLEFRIDLFAEGDETPSAEANTAKLMKILKILDERIQEGSEDGQLAEHPLFARVAQKWHQFGRKAKARRWLRETCESDERLVDALMQFGSFAETTGDDGAEHITREYPVHQIAELFGRSELARRCRELLESESHQLTSVQEQTIEFIAGRL